jgi:hypothetical protein
MQLPRPLAPASPWAIKHLRSATALAMGLCATAAAGAAPANDASSWGLGIAAFINKPPAREAVSVRSSPVP